jgi:phosphate transport system substrate-binding protein
MTSHILHRRAWIARSGLALALALAIAGSAAAADELRIGGTGSALGTMRTLAEAYVRQHPGTTFVVLPSLGSSGGIKAAIVGAVDVAVSARPASEAEARGGAKGFELGRTPFVFVTSPANPARGVALRELVDIYAGRQERWPDGSRIRLVMRPTGDSDHEALQGMSPAMREAVAAAERRPGMVVALTDQDAADSAEQIPGALGPSTLALVRSERRALKVLPIDGVVPDAASLADGSYRWSKPVFLVIGEPLRPGVAAFLAFVRSSEGRALLQTTGYWVN